MIQLFHTTSQNCSRIVTENYSTSFFSAIRMLHKDLRQPVFNIYGFVRFADEIVDTFHDYDKSLLLQQFRTETYDAIKRGIRYKNILTKAIGAFKKITPDIVITPAYPKDLYMMCSDGLSDYVTDEEISCILSSSLSLKEQTLNLINMAKAKGSCDNITVLITQIEP